MDHKNLCAVPPMGWNSWNTFAENINEEVIMSIVDRMKAMGYQEARQFAEWGVDYLKYDNCFKPQRQDVQTLYRRMGLALKNCGRDIVFSACEWGFYDVFSWIKSTGAHLFRSTININDSWNSIRDIAVSQLDKMQYSAPYCHNDMDMLVVGMHGIGGNDYIAAGGCTTEEYQTHFALWAIMNSPLMI